jgi:hypothetical protein
MKATWTEARLSAQKRDRVRDVCPGRFAVAVTSLACSFDEQRRYDRQLLCQRFVHRQVFCDRHVCIGIHSFDHPQ